MLLARERRRATGTCIKLLDAPTPRASTTARASTRSSWRSTPRASSSQSGCLSGELNQLLPARRRGARPTRAAVEMRDIFGPSTTTSSCSATACDGQEEVNEALLAHRTSAPAIPLVATNDIHYVRARGRAGPRGATCASAWGKTRGREAACSSRATALLPRRASRWARSSATCEDAARPRIEIADRCDLELDFGNYHLPVVRGADGGEDTVALPTASAREGAERRYGTAHHGRRASASSTSSGSSSEMGFVLLLPDHLGLHPLGARERASRSGPGAARRPARSWPTRSGITQRRPAAATTCSSSAS